MAAPTLSMTFGELIIRVAEYLGVANYDSGAAAIPTDAHDLDLCKRLVNDGFRRFVNANPRWQWLNLNFDITFDPDGVGAQCVNSEAYRYYMPAGNFGNFDGVFTYPATGPRLSIRYTSESIIRQFRAGGRTSGDPSYFSVRPLPASLQDSNKTRFEVIFYPTPGNIYTVTCKARVYPDKMTDVAEPQPAGFQFDECILFAALAESEMQRTNVRGPMEERFKETLASAILIDRQSAQQSLGYNGDNSDEAIRSSRYRPTSYAQVDTYNNVSV